MITYTHLTYPSNAAKGVIVNCVQLKYSVDNTEQLHKYNRCSAIVHGSIPIDCSFTDADHEVLYHSSRSEYTPRFLQELSEKSILIFSPHKYHIWSKIRPTIHTVKSNFPCYSWTYFSSKKDYFAKQIWNDSFQKVFEKKLGLWAKRMASAPRRSWRLKRSSVYGYAQGIMINGQSNYVMKKKSRCSDNNWRKIVFDEKNGQKPHLLARWCRMHWTAFEICIYALNCRTNESESACWCWKNAICVGIVAVAKSRLRKSMQTWTQALEARASVCNSRKFVEASLAIRIVPTDAQPSIMMCTSNYKCQLSSYYSLFLSKIDAISLTFTHTKYKYVIWSAAECSQINNIHAKWICQNQTKVSR